MSHRQTRSKAKEVTFDLVAADPEKGGRPITFLPEDDAAEDFLVEAGLICDPKEGDSAVDGIRLDAKKCTLSDLKSLFVEGNDLFDNDEKSELEEICPFDRKPNMRDELMELGIPFGSDADVDIEELDMMEDDFVIKGFAGDDFDFADLTTQLLSRYADDLPSNSEGGQFLRNESISRRSGISACSVARSEGLTNIDDQFESILRDYDACSSRETSMDDSNFTCSFPSNEPPRFKDISLESDHFQSVMNEFLTQTGRLTVSSEDNDSPTLHKCPCLNLNTKSTASEEEGSFGSDILEEEEFPDDLAVTFNTKPPRRTILDEKRVPSSSRGGGRNSLEIIRVPSKVVISSRTGLPREVQVPRNTFKDDLDSYISDVKSTYSTATVKRDHRESAEEKRLRKMTIKKYKQLRRCEKKANKEAFSQEADKLKRGKVNTFLTQGKTLTR